MRFETMDDVRAAYARQATLIGLRVEARDLCNALCHMLDWERTPEDRHRIMRVLIRARIRLERREVVLAITPPLDTEYAPIGWEETT